MSLESSIKILYDENGNQLALSQSQQIPISQSYLLMAASGSTGQVVPLLVTDQGHLFVTGTLSATVTSSIVFPATQSVYLASGSSGFSSDSPLWITGSVTSTGGTGGGTVDQGASGSVPWKTEIIQSGSVVSNTNPLYVSPGRYYATSFGQARTVGPYTLVDNVNKYGFDPIEYSTSSLGAGSASILLNESATRFTVGTGSTDSIIMRSNTYYRYQAGKELVWKISAYNSDIGKTNQIRTWGFGDDNDGIFYCVSGTNFGILRKSSTSGIVVETFTSQSSFNIDKIDGSGLNSFALDITKANIYESHLQWLGAGYVDFFINGTYVHSLNFPNTLNVPYMKTANLPIQFQVKNSGVSTAGGFTYICSSVESDGGTKPPEFSFAAYNSTAVTIGTTEASILAIRPGLLFRTVQNRIVTIPNKLSISTEGSRAGFRIVLNPVISGTPLWLSASINNSCIEYTTSSLTYTGGETIYKGFLPNSNDAAVIELDDFFQENGRKLRIDAFGIVQDVLLITGINEQAGTTAMNASLSWKEVR